RRLAGESELWQGEVRGEGLEADLNAGADGDPRLRLGCEVRRDEVTDQAEPVVRGWGLPLLVQLDHDDRIRRPLLEAGLDRGPRDLGGVDRAPPAHGLPRPFKGLTPRAARSGRIAEEAAAPAAAEDQPPLPRRLEVAVPLRVVLGNDQGHPAVLDPQAAHVASRRPTRPLRARPVIRS